MEILQIKKIAKKKKYRSYEDAKAFVQGLGIKSLKEWNEYSKSGQRPEDIPSTPNQVYKSEWKGWGDFLGTGRIAYYNRTYMPYEDAKAFVRGLGIKSRIEWKAYCKSGQISEDIPSSPDHVYKSEWKGMGEFLGTGSIANYNRTFMSYEDAKAFVQGLGIKSFTEWREYCKSGKKPEDIPTTPEQVYKSEWNGWADFLGYLGNGNTWTKTNLIAFLEQFKPFMYTCTDAEFLTIVEANGLYKYLSKSVIKKLTETLPDSNERIIVADNIIKEITKHQEDEDTTDILDVITDDIISDIINPVEIQSNTQTENTTSLRIKQLKALDNNVITASLDDDRINFIIAERLNNLWYDFLNNTLTVEEISNAEFTSHVPTLIKETFIKEIQEVINLKLPKNWIYPHEPLLMQKLISYRLLQYKRYANFSGVGSGKTISAILAGRYVGAKNTLVIAFNSTIGRENERGWTKEIKDAFKDSNIYKKGNKEVTFDNSKHNYLVLNYETFQQKSSAKYVIDLIKRNKFDFVVLDEVQCIKQRDSNESKRREVILGLLDLVKKSNPDYYLLAMSATPVINNLSEMRSILELIQLTDLSDIDTRETIQNCIELYRRSTIYGIRYKNAGSSILKNNSYTLINVNGDHLYDKVKHLSNIDFLKYDQLTLHTKLDAVLPYVNTSKGKTVFYITYVTEIEEPLYNYLVSKGFNPGVYTGNQSKFHRESTLTDFIQGKYDVLIASRPITYGVDGLQKVSDRLIVMSLPFTNADIVQAQGRVDRLGSNFVETGVEVIIPLVTIGKGKKAIRWDHRRYNTITYKETIANAAVDGIIPDKLITSKEDFIEDAIEYLDEWIERIKNDNIYTTQRKDLDIEIFPEINDTTLRSKRVESELQKFDKRGRIMRSETMHKEFSENPHSWFYYHSLRKEAMKNWEEIPYVHIATKIQSEGLFDKHDNIIDFGCGTNEFKSFVENKVISIDHISFDDSVIACDMKDISTHVSNETQDIAVFSLALWGPNFTDYLKEAHRVLRKRGIVYIAESTKSYKEESEREKLSAVLESVGFKMQEIEIKDKFTYFTAIKTIR